MGHLHQLDCSEGCYHPSRWRITNRSVGRLQNPLWLESGGYSSVTGLFRPSVFLVAVIYARCDHILIVTFLTLSLTTGGCSAAGVFINQIDIAPRYAGFLFGITNTFGSIPGAVAPIVTGYFTEDHTLAGWAKVFWLTAGISASGAVIYTLFGTGRVQPWALTEEERAEAERKRNRSISH